jgi:trehalose-6-phosphate synthase
MDVWIERDQVWSRDSLAPYLQSLLAGRPLVIVSNREPWIHSLSPESSDTVRVERPASGLVSALEPLAEATGGTWIALGQGSADRLVVDGGDSVTMPPESPRYRLRRLWLNQGQIDGYYREVSNRGLWPMCHLAYVAPRFEPRHWQTYRQVNALFARSILEETPQDGAVVFVQDYHLALVPKLIKLARPSLTVVQFWHIPWPPAEQVRSCPYADELIEGLLGNDVLGFQTDEHCQHFVDTLVQIRTLSNASDGKSRHAYWHPDEKAGEQPARHRTLIGSFPISIDFDAWSTAAGQPGVDTAIKALRQELDLDGQRLGIGIDRLDYTKGLLQRLDGLDHLFELHPEWVGQLLFLQVLAPSRQGIETYDQLRMDIERRVQEINERWRHDQWQPLQLQHQQHRPEQIQALHRLADFCVVSSIDDGMNLVAKEFVASRFDSDGVLILSRYAGCAKELTDALQVNPYARHEIAQAIHEALTMSQPIRRHRMVRMREQVRRHNIYRWSAELLGHVAQKQPIDEAFIPIAGG